MIVGGIEAPCVEFAGKLSESDCLKSDFKSCFELLWSTLKIRYSSQGPTTCRTLKSTPAVNWFGIAKLFPAMRARSPGCKPALTATRGSFLKAPSSGYPPEGLLERAVIPRCTFPSRNSILLAASPSADCFHSVFPRRSNCRSRTTGREPTRAGSYR